MSQFSHPHTSAPYNTTGFTRVSNNFNAISGGKDKDLISVERTLPYIPFDKDFVLQLLILH